MDGYARFARGLLACGSVFATAETRSYAEFASPAARVLNMDSADLGHGLAAPACGRCPWSAHGSYFRLPVLLLSTLIHQSAVETRLSRTYGWRRGSHSRGSIIFERHLTPLTHELPLPSCACRGALLFELRIGIMQPVQYELCAFPLPAL